jgi:signal transduction histidine kinase
LAAQLADRAQMREDTLSTLPPEAQDLSLRGLSAAVLRSYDDLLGGFFIPSTGAVLGATASGAAEEIALDPAQMSLIRSLTASTAGVAKTLPHGRDVLVGATAPPQPDGTVAWTIKRITGVRDPMYLRRQWGLLALVLLAMTAVGGVIAMSMRLRRGVDAVNSGLQKLESDFWYRFPPIPGDFGAIAGAINHMTDKRAELETTLRRQDRLAALGKVVAGVAHEIRNPLNSMRLALELANRRLKKGNATGEEIAGAIEEVDRLDRIVTRLLAFGKPEFEDRRIQDVRPLIERVTHMLEQPAAGKQVRFEVAVPDTRAEAHVDALQIEQVLINLLLNAIEASPGGSPVQVVARNEPDSVCIEVRDHGPGVPPSIRDHIFDPYFTTKPAGSGLGLAVSREFVDRHGGTLTVESNNGNGAAFVMRLPAAKGVE